MIDRLFIWVNSKPFYWRLRTKIGKIRFVLERGYYMGSTSVSKVKANVRILGTFTWIGIKSLFWVFLGMAILIFTEGYVRAKYDWLPPLSADDKEFNLEQLRLYAQLLTAIFSIYFASIGIILSGGYTKLRRDIIQMLTNEQVGSIYSRVLVLAATFCLWATALPIFGFKPGLFVYVCGTALTLLGALALFPLGQRLFNFFDLNLLVSSAILPNVARHIEGAANPRNSISLANHHSKTAHRALEQLSYIDDRVKADIDGLDNNLPTLSDDYTNLMLHYLKQKHTIDQESYWFPRRNKHKQWFFAGDTATSMALQTSSQLHAEKALDRYWLENEIIDRLANHIDLAFRTQNFELALNLLGRFSVRLSAYAQEFQFNLGMQELKRFKEIIEKAFASAESAGVDQDGGMIKVGLSDSFAALGSNLCIETMRRMIIFEEELKGFFEMDNWSRESLRRLPAFLQVELVFIVERIEYEQKIEGRRLSGPKYVQQLAVQKLLEHYAETLPSVCEFYTKTVPDFVDSLVKMKMSEASTQVVLASLHSHWKLPGWFDHLAHLLDRYKEYNHYTERQYTLAEINIAELSAELASARDDAISKLGSGEIVKHIFESKHNDELPDHFGQIYFELAEACINALEQNDHRKLNKVFPMFSTLAFLAADFRFADLSLEVNDEYRLHLVSTVINDMASVIGFAILYGAYFDNEKLSENPLTLFNSHIERVPDKTQYLRRMLLLSNPHSFSMSASPRGLIRISWKQAFEHRARSDGYQDQMQIRTQRAARHPNHIVRGFLQSHSDASHLFFALQVLPQLEQIDFEIDYHINDLIRRFRDDKEQT